jgi:hypothetical protein
MEHTKEPWEIIDGSIYSVTYFGNDGFGCDKIETEIELSDHVDALRIVACVNACAGITNQELLAADLKVAVLANVLSQRDKLLSALDGILDCISETRGKYVYDKVDHAKKLIAEIKADQ